MSVHESDSPDFQSIHLSREEPALQSATEPARPKEFILAILLFLLAMIPFFPAIHGEYVWDDDVWLVNNSAVHAWNGLQLIWNPFAYPLDYYPITFSVLWLEHKLWHLNPVGYHLVNILCHAGGTLLLWRCLRRLGFRSAWFAALLWAIHPIQVESVAWVAEIKNCLSGFFYFLAAWAYLRFERVGDGRVEISANVRSAVRIWPFYVFSLLFFVLALLSKTVVVTLPVGLLIVLWCSSRGPVAQFLRRSLPLLPMLILGVAIASFRAHQEHLAMQIGGSSNLVFTLFERVIIAGKDVWFYFRTLFFPYPLMAIYPRWNYDPTLLANYIPALGVAILGAALAFLRRRIGPWPLGALLFFLITLSPALGFVNFTTMRFTFVADHYQYIASLGVLVFIAELLIAQARAMANPFRFRFAAALLIVVVLCITGFYDALYQTEIKLWSWNVDHNPAAFTAQYNLGAAYMRVGRVDEGIKLIRLALQQAPDDDSIQRAVGGIDFDAGRYDEAIDHLQKAIAIRPQYGDTYVLLGRGYDRMGRLNDALAAYAQAIAVSPTLPSAYVYYARDLKTAGKFDQAAHAYETALSFEPGNMTVRYNYGNILLDMNRNKEAISAYEFILKYQPNNPAIWDNLAAAYYQDGQMDKALDAKKRAKAFDSPSPK